MPTRVRRQVIAPAGSVWRCPKCGQQHIPRWDLTAAPECNHGHDTETMKRGDDSHEH